MKGGFKKPPKNGDVENFEIKTKRDDPTKAVNFKYGFWVSDVNGQPVKSVDENGEWERAWCKVVSRIQAQGSVGSTPQSAPSRPANAPQGHASPSQAARVVPTMSQAVAVLRECVGAVAGWGSEAHATTLFLGRLRGDIRRDPTAAELAAEKEAKQAIADVAAKKAEDDAEALKARLREQAGSKPKVEDAGYEPGERPVGTNDGTDDIPF